MKSPIELFLSLTRTCFAVVITALFLLPSFPVVAQKIDLEKLKEFKPRNIGPAGMSGRVTAIDVITNQPEVIYVGTASGGLWKSESGGINWEPIFEKEPVMSIGSVAIDQSNPDVIYVGTGEGNPRNSNNGGNGIYKSLDGGKTWKHMGLDNTRHIHRIIVNKNNPDIVYAGSIGSPWAPHPEKGVYKSTDGGKSWKNVLFVNDLTGCADLVADPKNPNKLFAAMWEHQRKPWTFNSGGKGSGLYRYVDGGESWERISDEDGLPKGELGRIGVAVAPSNPRIVYALVESKKNALYKSEDGGYKWKKINDKNNIGNRPFYYSEIYVDPNNENRLYSLFSFVNVSEDGGKSFDTFAASYVLKGIHPDHHAWYIHPTDPNYIIDGNDGGLNITRDRGKSWRFAENLPLAQFYHINVDMDIPYNVYGGMQDNGSWGGPAYVFRSGGIRNSYWQELMFGDGFDVVPDPDNSRYGYAMSQGGNVGRYDKQTGFVSTIRPTHPDPSIKLRFNWNAAIEQDPFNNSTIYYGSQFVHKSTDKGNNWEIISPDLTTNNPEKQKQYESGGLTIDATGAENNTTILAIETSPTEVGVIWVGTDDGNLQLTRDSGNTWQNVVQNAPGFPKESWIAQIHASAYNNGEAFVIVNNYRMGDYTPYLFHTTDYGATWESMITANQVSGFTLSFIQDPVEPKLMFLGTDYGLYVTIDAGSTWTKWTNGYPSVPTADMVIHPREHDLVIGSYGRAAYILDDIQPLRELASEGTGILSEELHVFAAPDAYLSANQQAEGTRFAGDGIYIGENRPRGARLSVMINKPEKEKEEKDQLDKPKKDKKKKKSNPPTPPTEKEEESKTKVTYDTLTVTIYNSKNELIRTIKKNPKENGLYRFTWSLREKGVRAPNRSKPKPNASEPRGVNVLPGKYKVVMNYGNKKDSTTVNVLQDSRLDLDISNLVARYNKQKELEDRIKLAADAMIRLVESKIIIDDISKQLKERKGDEYKSLKDSNKAMKDSIETLMAKFVGPDNSKKQGIMGAKERSVNNYLFTARRYLGSGIHQPGATEERVLDHVDIILKPALEEVNTFYQTAWPEYKKQVESVELSPFKDYEPLKMN